MVTFEIFDRVFTSHQSLIVIRRESDNFSSAIERYAVTLRVLHCRKEKKLAGEPERPVFRNPDVQLLRKFLSRRRLRVVARDNRCCVNRSVFISGNGYRVCGRSQ